MKRPTLCEDQQFERTDGFCCTNFDNKTNKRFQFFISVVMETSCFRNIGDVIVTIIMSHNFG